MYFRFLPQGAQETLGTSRFKDCNSHGVNVATSTRNSCVKRLGQVWRFRRVLIFHRVKVLDHRYFVAHIVEPNLVHEFQRQEYASPAGMHQVLLEGRIGN